MVIPSPPIHQIPQKLAPRSGLPSKPPIQQGEFRQLSNGDTVFLTFDNRPILVTKEQLDHIRDLHQADTDIPGSRINSDEDVLTLIREGANHSQGYGLKHVELDRVIGTDNLVRIRDLELLMGTSLDEALAIGWIRVIPGQSIDRNAENFNPRAGRYEVVFDALPQHLRDRIVAQPTNEMNAVLGSVPQSADAFPGADKILARWDIARIEAGLADISHGMGLITAFPGKAAPKFPEDLRIRSENERQAAVQFWTAHVFVNRSPTDTSLGESLVTDITIASEGQKALHEGRKVSRKWILKKRPHVLAKDAEPGVNDIIRELRSNGFYRDLEASDLESVAEQLKITGYTDLANQLRKGEKKISIYRSDKSQLADTTAKERGEFVSGIATHAGIRTANIHITSAEYARLRGIVGHMSVAARVIHEVYEIDAWREEAKKRGIKLGIVSDEYDENWESGIRKWIIDSLADPEKRDEIIALDREIHGEGLYREMTAMIQYIRRQQMISSLKNLGDYLTGKADRLEQGDGILNTFRTEETRKEFVKLLIVIHPDFPSSAESRNIVQKVLIPRPNEAVSMKQGLIFGLSLYYYVEQTSVFGRMHENIKRRWESVQDNKYGIKERIKNELDLERIQNGMIKAIDKLTKLSAVMNQLGVITTSQRNLIEEHLKSYESLFNGVPEFSLRLQGPAVDRLKQSIVLVRDNLRLITLIDYIPPTYTPSFTYSFSDSSDVVLAMKEVRRHTPEDGQLTIGGVNSNQTIQSLTRINNISIKKLERDLRQEGSLGKDESLIERLAEDNTYVLTRGFTHQQLAEPLLKIVEALNAGTSTTGLFTYNGRKYTLHKTRERGYYFSLFKDGVKSDGMCHIIDVTEDLLKYDPLVGKVKRRITSLDFSEAVVHFIHKYGFYEGESSRYRIDPKDIIDLFFSTDHSYERDPLVAEIAMEQFL